ncbi:FMN-dependent NADH-azoreductase [Gulosibacter sp. 10]|uniref:FMN-dependent NADH-azoreductase n=1 Tax=Gulosibacter sp. 10 TaxID=1255570 RepID=UPI000B34BC35|nr:NAD(P)H-dependent oxidoreductase [Gulosibacter sp. 10]
MPRLLRIDSSISDDSRTRRIGDAFQRVWEARGEDYSTVARDLVADPLPHFSALALHFPERLRDGRTAPPELEAQQRAVLEELGAADALLIGAPMYNFSMPSQLKAWIDLVHVPGLTAPFDSDTQPYRGRTAYVVSARGAAYDPGSPEEAMDHVIPPIRIVLEQGLGIPVVPVVTSRTLAPMLPALGVERAQAEFDAAVARAEELAARA